MDLDGTFEASFPYVAAGDYAVDFVPPTGITTFTTNPARPIAVTVTSGGSATQAATLLTAAP